MEGSLFAIKSPSVRRWFMLIPLILSGVWFSALERTVLRPEYQMHIRLDDYIPFMPSFVVPYVLWYAFVAVPAFFLFWKSPEEFIKMSAFLSLGMFIACTAYTLFPNGQSLRPVLSSDHANPLVRLVSFIYSKDTPANCAPSIHVIYSVSAYAAIARYNDSNWQSVWVKGISMVLACLCILSTVFIKQHSAVDLIAGLFVSGLLYFLLYGLERIKRKNRQTVGAV